MPLLSVVPSTLASRADKGRSGRILRVQDIPIRLDGRRRKAELAWVVSNRLRAESDLDPVLLPTALSTREGSESWVYAVYRHANVKGAALYTAGWGLEKPDSIAHVWFFRKRTYATEDLALNPGDIRALVNEQANRRRLQLEKAHALQAMTEHLDRGARREPIPQDVKVAVWQRDGGRCVDCHSQIELEFDHIIPLAMGGANTMRNLQLLCAVCNRRKGATLG